MSAIAIITARGGSKRIPHKNIRSFCGKPILSYSIAAALHSELFDEVMVSTDSAKIAEIAKNHGATVPFYRSERTSDDFATTADVLIEVIEQYRLRGRAFDTICCLYPTAPFVTAEKLQQAMTLMLQNNVDSVIPVIRYSYPPQRAFLIKDNLLRYQYPQYERARSQDLEPIYHDCGQFYLYRTASFLEAGKGLLYRTVPFVLPEEEVQDIDTLSDWALAEMKYKAMMAKEGSLCD